MTRPATLPELLAQGKVKPGDWVECITTDAAHYYEVGERLHISPRGLIRQSLDGSAGTFRPVKPAKAKKWGEWGQITGESRVTDHMISETGMQVKRTKDGSLMIRYRRKG